jgi:hypothetical protein
MVRIKYQPMGKSHGALQVIPVILKKLDVSDEESESRGERFAAIRLEIPKIHFRKDFFFLTHTAPVIRIGGNYGYRQAQAYRDLSSR